MVFALIKAAVIGYDCSKYYSDPSSTGVFSRSNGKLVQDTLWNHFCIVSMIIFTQLKFSIVVMIDKSQRSYRYHPLMLKTVLN